MLFSRKNRKNLSALLCASAAALMFGTAPMLATPVFAKELGYSGAEMPDNLADLIAHVSPAVVNIKVVTGGAAAGNPNADATEGQGSGFIVTPDGKIVTNFHVIEGGDKITVDFANGEEFSAVVIGTDRETDLAVLQIQATRTFDHVAFYHGADVRIGDPVLAIGNPFGIGQSSSTGIISAVGRERVDSGSYVDYLQTDATVNRGNSGGPLFNLQGHVVGVNSAIYSPTGASVGIAFVIPHYLAEDIAVDLIQNGKVNRGFVGVTLRDAERDKGGFVVRQGASIESVGAGSPADQAGLQVEDIILKINQTEIKTSTEAARAIARLRAGDYAYFVIERKDEILDFKPRVLVASRPATEDELLIATGGSASTAPAVTGPAAPQADSMYNTGLSLTDLSATFRDAIGMPRDQVGVYVDAVAPGSSAARKGIKSGMVILQADGKLVPSVPHFRQIIETARGSGQRSLTLLIRTANGSETYTSISLN